MSVAREDLPRNDIGPRSFEELEAAGLPAPGVRPTSKTLRDLIQDLRAELTAVRRDVDEIKRGNRPS